MSTWSVRYVRLGDRARAVERLRALGVPVGAGAPTDIPDAGTSPFAAWLVPTPRFEPEDLSALSRDFGEALSIAVQTVADLVVYDHFVDGSRVRGLTYAGEAGWVRVVGEAEPWEAAALFAASRLEELVEELEQELTEDALAREKADLERLWNAGKLHEGSTRPPADPAVVARAIEKHFGLPAKPKT